MLSQRVALLVAALAAWWVGFRVLNPWVQRLLGWDTVQLQPDLKLILSHWLVWQLPATLLCLGVWVVGARFGLMPGLRASLGSGGSWRRVLTSGLWAALVLLLLTVGIGAAVGGRFGFHPPFSKMAGDLLSNLYEELVNRGLIFCALYGVAARATFPLSGALHRVGVIVAVVGSSALFAAGHGQYPIALRVVLGVMGVVFAWPWIRARSIWAPWLMHMLGDVVGDSILKL